MGLNFVSCLDDGCICSRVDSIGSYSGVRVCFARWRVLLAEGCITIGLESHNIMEIRLIDSVSVVFGSTSKRVFWRLGYTLVIVQGWVHEADRIRLGVGAVCDLLYLVLVFVSTHSCFS